MMCRGAVIVERLIGAGRPVAPVEGAQDPVVVERVAQRLCPACAFQENDCDFRANGKARPCGGLELLSRLFLDGRLALDEL